MSDPLPTPGEDDLRVAEALVFASAEPVGLRLLADVLSGDVPPDIVMREVQSRWAGRAVELVEVAGGWQFRTAPDVAERLRRVVKQPRRLPRAAMETLAVVAYHQPCTRPEIEELRGASLGQNTMDLLLEAELIAPAGRREVPGRPVLWTTTPHFLAQFGLRGLSDLPRREDLLVDPTPRPAPEQEGEGQGSG